MQGCYLLHFASPISPDHTCQHYIGWASDVRRRMAEHRSGHGARLTQVALARGIAWTVAQIWPGGDRALERKLKNRHGSRLCPICGRAHGVRQLAFVDTITVDEADPLAF